MTETVRRAFVCGHPISHSRSPLIHSYWLKRHGILGSYESINVEPQNFAQFFNEFRSLGFLGGNVTIPHKEVAFMLADRHDEAAEAIGAVNTVWLEDGLVCGGNTDAAGFAANLDDNTPGWDKASAAVVLGAGGSARAVVYALKMRGISDIRIVNRTVSRAAELADSMGGFLTAHSWEALPELLRDAGVLVNTTPLGMSGKGEIDLDLASLAENAIVCDIVYMPLETPILAAARRRGLKTVTGIGMLLHQAVPGFEKWFGVKPEVTAELRDLAIADVERER